MFLRKKKKRGGKKKKKKKKLFQGKPERTESFILIRFGLGFVAVVAVVFVLLFCCVSIAAK